VESWRPGLTDTVLWQGQAWQMGVWKEWVESGLTPQATFSNGKGAIYQQQNRHYLAFWPNREFLQHYLAEAAQHAGLTTQTLPEGLRLRRRDTGSLPSTTATSPRPFRLLLAPALFWVALPWLLMIWLSGSRSKPCRFRATTST